MFHVRGIWKKAMTAATAMSEMAKFKRLNTTFSRGNSILLMRIFLMRGAESMMELMAPDVASLMNVNRVWPRIR